MALGSWARSKLHSGPACARPALHALSPCFSSACSWARLRPHAGVVPWGSSALDAWVRGVSGANPSLSGRRPELAPHTQLPGADVDSAVRPEWCRMVRLKSWGGRGNRHGQFPNQSLQQMVTVVTVRAKHGPRQPRPLLKHVVRLKGAKAQGLGFKRGFRLAHPCFRGHRCARSRLAHSSSLGAALAAGHGSTVPVACRCSNVPSLSRVLVFLALSRRLLAPLSRSGYGVASQSRCLRKPRAKRPVGLGGGSASGVRGVGAESAGFAGGRLCMIMGENDAVLGLVPHVQSSWFGTGLIYGGRQSNQSLQQTKPPVTSPACAGAAPAVFAAEARC